MEYCVKKIQEIDWSQVQRAELTHTGWLPLTPIRAWAQLCHDGQRLYIRMEAEESPVVARLSGPLDQVCSDSCVEFFFAPDPTDERYLNFEVNPLGNMYVGFGGARPTRVRQIPKNPEELFRPEPFRTNRGWGICWQVTEEFVRRYFPNFRLAGECACNFYKCGDETPAPHYLSWNPMTAESPDFHRRRDFGTLIFE